MYQWDRADGAKEGGRGKNPQAINAAAMPPFVTLPLHQVTPTLDILKAFRKVCK